MARSGVRKQTGYDWHGQIVGRDREQATLCNSLDVLQHGRGGLVLVGGEAGIGKTSLVESLISNAQENDIRIASSACYDLMVTPPYGPWLELFGELSGNPDELPTLGALAERQPGQDALYSDVLDFLRQQAGRGPAIAVLEDLHWSDAASLELLRYVARHISGLPLLLIGTYRDNELDRSHPLQQLLPMLVRESHATRINLRPLNETAIRALIDTYYGLTAADATRIVDYLDDRTEGNPFFIGETLRALEEQDFLSLEGEQWSLGDIADVPVPPLVQQVIEGRLSHLDSDARYLLSVAAVAGAEISLDVWSSAAGTPEDALTHALQQALDLHLMDEDPRSGTLRFTHALIREALYYELGLPTRRKLHRSIGESMELQPAPDPDAVAYHLREGGHERAVRWLVLAGERAQRLYAWRTAAERFEAVLPLLSTGPETLELKGWLCYRIGILLIYADPERAIEHLTASERIANECDDPHLAAYARADRGLIRCLTGDVRRGRSEMQSGVACLDELPAIELSPAGTGSVSDDGALAVEGIKRGAFDLIGTANELNLRKGALVFWLAWAGRYAETIEIGEAYVRQVPEGAPGMQDSLGDALAGLGHAYAALGRPDQALNAFARARATYQLIDHHFKVGNTAIYELSEALLPFRADRVMEREWLADQAEAG